MRKWQSQQLTDLATEMERAKVLRNAESRLAELEYQLAQAKEQFAEDVAQMDQRDAERNDIARQLADLFPAAEFKDSDDDLSGSDADGDSPPEHNAGSAIAAEGKEEAAVTFETIMGTIFNVDYSEFGTDADRFAHMSNSRSLIAIGATRWMTYVDMARRFMMWRWALQKSLAEIDRLRPANVAPPDWTFSTMELTYLKVFVTIGTAAQDILVRLQGSLLPTISSLLYNYIVLQRNVDRWADDSSEMSPIIRAFCKRVSSNLFFKFDPDQDRTALIAAILDPRHRKLAFLEFHPFARMIGHQALKAEWQTLKYQRDAEDLSTAAPAGKKARTSRMSLDELAGFNASSSEAITEYDRYLLLEDEKNCGDVLNWWRGHESDYPLIAVLARRYLAIPASSASSERLFSRLKETHTVKRNRMSPKAMCQLLFVQHHMQYLQENKP